jgi:hypothetical protein
MRSVREQLAILALIAGAPWVVSCAGAGAQGHSPQYAEVSEERAASAGARDYDPVMAARQPEAWRKGTVTLFGIVESRAAGPGGQALLRLSVRRLEPRNLCERPGNDDTCRVTVSDKDFGVVWALASLRADDDLGPHAVGQRSLVRVVGTLGQDVSPVDGSPVVHATYCRHFPPADYATSGPSRTADRTPPPR